MNIRKHRKIFISLAILIITMSIVFVISINKVHSEESPTDWKLKALKLQLSLDTTIVANHQCTEQLNILNTIYIQKLKKETSDSTTKALKELSDYQRSLNPKKESTDEKDTNSGN